MSGTFCKYHHDQRARHYCPECNIYFCGACVSYAPQAAVKYPCPVCKNATQEVSVTNLIEPVWNRIPQLIAFPANAKTIITLVMLMFGLLFVVGASFMFGRFGLLTILIWAFFFLQHGFTLVAHIAHRGLHKDSLGLEGEIEKAPVIKFLLVSAAYVFVLGFLGMMGVIGELGVGVFGFLYGAMIPALIILLIVSDSIFRALNPLQIFGVALEIGPSYLALVGLTTVSGWAGQAGAGLLAQYLPVWLAVPAVFTAVAYFWYVQMCFIGYVLHQHHDKFGVQVHVEQVVGQTRSAVEPIDANVSQAQILMAEGKHEEALDFLSRMTRIETANEALNDYYQKLLSLEGKAERQQQHAQQYVRSLCFAGKQHKALQVVQQVLQQQPKFVMDNAKVSLDLAKLASLQGSHRLVVQLLSQFASRFKGAVEIPEAYYLAAKSLSDGLGRDAEALKILQSVEKQFPDAPVIEDVRALRQLVESLLTGAR